MSLTITEEIETVSSFSIPAAEAAPRWQDVAERRREEIYSGIPQDWIVPQERLESRHLLTLPETCGILSPRELEITALTATRLLELLHNETYTAVEVTTAFCKRAAIAHQATNCLAVILFQQALADAAVLDEYMQTHHKPRGPLHGLPISVKEHVYLENTISTSGFVLWADDVSKEDALIVKILREAGAVFHVKTTNPQALMALETVSNIYGTTTNPHNTDLSPGGSSGGEGALIAMRGSLLGIGTDIGGSIRVPCAFSGIYGIKPSIARLPHGGLAGVHGGMENIIGCVGPMATCSEDLRLFCRVVLDTEPWHQEPTLVEMPWKPSAQIPKKLKIGVMYHDDVVQLHPPVARCLAETVKALEQAGHTIVNWDPKFHKDIGTCIDQFYLLDGGEEYHEVIEAGNEPPTPLMQWLFDRVGSKSWSARETWKINKRREVLQFAYAAQWNNAGIDALLCPVNPAAASAHGESTYWGYSSVFNLLDYSASIFPASTVSADDTWDNYPRQATTDLSVEDSIFREAYTGPEKYALAPVSLQLVTRRYREEVNLLMVEEVVRCIGGA